MNAEQSPLVELPGRYTGVLVRSVGRPGTPWKVVQGCTQAGIKIQPMKTMIFQSEVEYLGHKVSRDGVQMLEDYIKKVPKWPRPTSCKKMSSFLGFQNINGVLFQGTLTNCMNSMKKALKFEWSEDMEKYFKELKTEQERSRHI